MFFKCFSDLFMLPSLLKLLFANASRNKRTKLSNRLHWCARFGGAGCPCNWMAGQHTFQTISLCLGTTLLQPQQQKKKKPQKTRYPVLPFLSLYIFLPISSDRSVFFYCLFLLLYKRSLFLLSVFYAFQPNPSSSQDLNILDSIFATHFLS